MFLRLIFCIFLVLLQHTQVNGKNRDFVYMISGGVPDQSKHNYSNYMVSIRSRVPRKFFGDNHFCTGVIISKNIVLTAAMCVMDKRKVITRPRRLLVVAGTPNRLDRIQTTFQYPVDVIKAHQNYILYNTNGVALIKIKGTFKENEHTKILDLPHVPPPYGSVCQVLGWGRLYSKGPLAAVAVTIDVTLLEENECNKRFEDKFVSGLLCAEGNHSDDPCRGDSGGPMICNNILTGIIALSMGCGDTDYPGVYIDIYDNLQWIKEKMMEAQIQLVPLPLYMYLFTNLILIAI